VRSVFGIPAAGQDDHVRADHREIQGQSFPGGRTNVLSLIGPLPAAGNAPAAGAAVTG
jgi:hypothetical protein